MGEENNVGDGVVYGQEDHGGFNILQDGSEDVEDIAEQPGDQEDQRETVGGGPAKILDDLRGEYDDPTCN